MFRHFSLKRQIAYLSFIHQMKAYDKRKCLFGVLTLVDIGMTQSQGRKCQIALLKPL